MASKLNEFVGRFSKNSKGVGAGVGALLAASGLFYGVTQSVFTGKVLATFSKLFICFFVKNFIIIGKQISRGWSQSHYF